MGYVVCDIRWERRGGAMVHMTATITTVRVTVLRGKISWQSGTKKGHEATPHNKVHSRDFLGGKNSGRWLGQE